MGFKIEQVNNARKNMPEGNYIHLDGIDWFVHELTISAAGKVCLKLHDPLRKENQIKTLCTLEELIAATVPGAVFKEI
jgi:hypothetical protein